MVGGRRWVGAWGGASAHSLAALRTAEAHWIARGKVGVVGGVRLAVHMGPRKVAAVGRVALGLCGWAWRRGASGNKRPTPYRPTPCGSALDSPLLGWCCGLRSVSPCAVVRGKWRRPGARGGGGLGHGRGGAARRAASCHPVANPRRALARWIARRKVGVLDGVRPFVHRAARRVAALRRAARLEIAVGGVGCE